MAPKSKKKNETRSKTSRGADAISQRQKTPAPNWPLFQPLIPSSQLYLEPIIENQIVVIKNFWTSTLCKNYVSFLKSLPLITTPGKPKKGEAVRVNDRFQIEDAAFAERLWSDTSLKELVTGAGAEGEDKNLLWGGEVLGLNPNIRIYRYSDGQFFAQHFC
ncbi:MAG: hypothetical protein M1834_000494 [Cirrosporium novae-zelandiae]|nr:MAG: hypothetical protein M1834_000494 [Cirrosporium novae-zelandiae]